MFIMVSRISLWECVIRASKTYLDKEQLFLFIILLILLPAPFFYFIIGGIAPLAYVICISFVALIISLASLDALALLYGFLLFIIHFSLNYLWLRLIICLVLKVINALKLSGIYRLVFIAVVSYMLLYLVVKNDVYSIGNIASLDKYDLIQFYRQVFLIFL
jgi:hypothetical protein